MRVAHDIRRVLHEHGIHSSTIQPEFHDKVSGPPEEHLVVRIAFPHASPLLTYRRPMKKHIASYLVHRKNALQTLLAVVSIAT